VEGGPLETVVEGAIGVSTMSPDGTILFGADGFPISRLVPNRTAVEAITQLDTAHGETGHLAPYFLPDGKRFLFLSVSRDPQRGTTRSVLCSGTIGLPEITRIGDIPSRVEYAVGHLFFVRGGTLMAQPFDISALKLTGEAVPVAENVGFNSRAAFAAFSVSQTGTIVYQPFGASRRLSAVDGAGKTLTTWNLDGLAGGRFALFPDGSRALLNVTDHRLGVVSLWVYGLTRDTATRLTFSPANESNPVMSPDGSRVFFASDAQGQLDIYRASADSSEAPALVIAAKGTQTPNDVSPDGSLLLYTSNETAIETKQDLYVLPLSGGAKPRPFLRTPAIENDARFAPDGKWVAYSSDVTGTNQIFVRPFPGPGAPRQVSTRGGRMSRFSVDGKRLYWVDGTKLMAADFHSDGSTSEPAVAFDVREQIDSYQLASGGRFILKTQNEAEASPAARVIVGWRP
jgi:eukaryotic-like serine/threonine-protein kinase